MQKIYVIPPDDKNLALSEEDIAIYATAAASIASLAIAALMHIPLPKEGLVHPKYQTTSPAQAPKSIPRVIQDVQGIMLSPTERSTWLSLAKSSPIRRNLEKNKVVGTKEFVLIRQTDKAGSRTAVEIYLFNTK